MSNKTVSRAIAYYRLSKEDKAKAVSDSIENQKKLIEEYVARNSDIEIVGEFYDDGYTGTNFARPGFCAVLEAIKKPDNEVNCIIVKDLSRLGREYIETGRFLEVTFPAMGVRFIAVNDGYDSSVPMQSDDIIIPVKNLMNESYCRELSRNLRRQFLIQRSKGEFLGAFASYGYLKSPEDKHKLVVDNYAAVIVKGIFLAKMQGFSQQAIANTLNSEGILCPSEYKRQQGLHYRSGFTTSATPKWTAVTVSKILKNSLYIGELVQGKRGTPNYKIKTVRELRQEEWIVVKDNHEAIIDPLLFETVQKILERDIRTSPHAETVFPLGGMVFCADCGKSALVRSVSRARKKYYYYVCSTYKHGSGCSGHSFEKNKLEEVVLNAIKKQIAMVVELDDLVKSIHAADLQTACIDRLWSQIEEKEKELAGYRDFKSRLLEALNDQLIDRDEFTRMRDKYRLLESECTAQIGALYGKINDQEKDGDPSRSWVEFYAQYQDIPTLTREVVTALVDKVIIHEDKRVEIEFNYRNEIEYFTKLVKDSLKEVG